MDIDKMFKMPALPKGAALKRKGGDMPTPDMLKRYKMDEPESQVVDIPVSNGKGKGRAATVEDEDDDDESGYVQPDTSFDDGEEDDEGRFFGGGLNSEQNQILDIFEKSGDDDSGAASLTVPALRRQLGKFERTVAKNAEQRGKYPDDPSKFIESESDLDSALNQFLPLTQNPPLFYPELVKAGAIALMCNLLSHENTDIALDVITVIQELTDEDVGEQADDLGEDGEGEGEGSTSIATRTPMVMAELIDELLNNSVLDLLVSNLGRLDEKEDTDQQGVYKILQVFENLLSFMPPLGEQIVAETTLLPWLVKRIQEKEYDSNKGYAGEILAILLGGGRENVMKLAALDGMEVLLKVVSQYRKKDPANSDEVEFMENIFDSICSALGETEMKAAFLEAEGVELMVIMMKAKMLARTRAIKVLDYAMQNQDGSDSCERFVECLGLKTFFSAFMGKGEGKRKKIAATSEFEDEEHLLGILVSLFTNLASDTPPRIRLIAKFIESDYEKVDRLLEMREFAESKLKAMDNDIAAERKEMEDSGIEVDDEQEDTWFLRRNEAGLSALQNADYVLAWVCMEDDGAAAHAKVMLERKGLSYVDIIRVLEDFAENIDDEVSEDPNGETIEEMPLQKMVIGQLVDYLKSR